MKHQFTLENDLAMIIELLSEMVEYKHLNRRQLEKIMKSYSPHNNTVEADLQPRKHVMDNIMNYSRSLEVYKSETHEPYSAIIN